MNYYLLFLRFLHIGAGVFWVGNTILLAAVINPGLKETGGIGQKFIDHLITKRRFGTESIGAGSMAGIAGLLLYWHDSNGLTSPWMNGSAGTGFAIGGMFGLIGYIFGVITDRQLKAMALLREQMGESPSAEQTSQLQALEKQKNTNLNISAGTLILSLWIMALARYFVF